VGNQQNKKAEGRKMKKETYREFEGKTEKEAIDRAIDDLGIDREEFDVEIVETSKKGLIFKKGTVKIRVHVSEEMEEAGLEITNDDQKSIISFLETVIEKMGYSGTVSIIGDSEQKLILNIDSSSSGILIGKKGKNLDALQLLTNVYAGKIGEDKRVIVDAEGYRSRREEALQRMARKTAEQVRKSRGSRLLEPMNPFERRLVHTALNDMDDIDTKSEGEGLYKQVRVIYRANSF
jgi:spoIIIJ-associated protein